MLRILDDTKANAAEERRRREAAEAQAGEAERRAKTSALHASTMASAAMKSQNDADDLRAKLNDNSFSGIAEKLGVSDAVPSSLNQLGARGGAGSRRLSDAGRGMAAVMGQVLNSTPLGRDNPGQLLNAVAGRRESRSTAIGQALHGFVNDSVSSLRDKALDVLGESWRANIKIGAKDAALTVLSLAVSLGVEDAVVISAFSYLPPIKVGETVRVSRGGNKFQLGVVEDLRNDIAVVSGLDFDVGLLVAVLWAVRFSSARSSLFGEVVVSAEA